MASEKQDYTSPPSYDTPSHQSGSQADAARTTSPANTLPVEQFPAGAGPTPVGSAASPYNFVSAQSTGAADSSVTYHTPAQSPPAPSMQSPEPAFHQDNTTMGTHDGPAADGKPSEHQSTFVAAQSVHSPQQYYQPYNGDSFGAQSPQLGTQNTTASEITPATTGAQDEVEAKEYAQHIQQQQQQQQFQQQQPGQPQPQGAPQQHYDSEAKPPQYNAVYPQHSGPNPNTQPISIALLQSHSAPVQCPRCHQTALTRTEFESGNTTMAWAVVAFCVCLCAVCIPFMVDSTKDVAHFCSNCGLRLCTWHRSGKLEKHYHG